MKFFRNYFEMNEPSNYVAKKQILAIVDIKNFLQNAYLLYEKYTKNEMQTIFILS